MRWKETQTSNLVYTVASASFLPLEHKRGENLEIEFALVLEDVVGSRKESAHRSRDFLLHINEQKIPLLVTSVFYRSHRQDSLG